MPISSTIRVSTRNCCIRCSKGARTSCSDRAFWFSGERRVLYFWHSLANRILTTFCNIVADVNLTDMETCYKAFRT